MPTPHNPGTPPNHNPAPHNPAPNNPAPTPDVPTSVPAGVDDSGNLTAGAAALAALLALASGAGVISYRRSRSGVGS